MPAAMAAFLRSPSLPGLERAVGAKRVAKSWRVRQVRSFFREAAVPGPEAGWSSGQGSVVRGWL